MGAPRGRKPQPGSRRTLAKVNPAGAGVAVQPERELTGTSARAWEVVIKDLNEQKIFAPSDALLLTTFCEMYGFADRERERMEETELRLEAVSEALDSVSPVDYDDDDSFTSARERLETREDTLSKALKRSRVAYMAYVKEMRALASEFAISPVARMRMGLMQLQGASLGAVLSELLSEDDDDEDVILGEVIE